MSAMRAEEEQFAGLNEVAKRVMLAGANAALTANKPGDVASPKAHVHGATTEVVYVTGGYDIWRAGDLAETDLSVEAAADIIVKEYRALKGRN